MAEAMQAQRRRAATYAEAEALALFEIIRSAAMADDLDGALIAALHTVASHSGWPYAECWSVDEAGGDIRLLPQWVGDRGRFAAFRATARSTTVAGAGTVLAATLARGEPHWVADTARLDDPAIADRLAAARDAGLDAVLLVPVRHAGATYAVMAFWVDHQRPGHHRMVAVAEAAATQLGAVVARIREREEATLDRQRVAAAVPGVIYRRILHADGRITYPYVSRPLAGYFANGTEPADLLALVHPDDRDAHRAAIHESARTLAPMVHTFRVRRPDGRIAWVETHALPRREDDGSVVWNGITIDVSGRLEAEAALADSRRLIAAIVDNAQVSLFRRVLSTDDQLHWEYLSPYLAAAIIESERPRPVAEALGFVHPDDRERFLDTLRASARNLTIHALEFRALRAGGSVRFFESRAVPRRRPDGGTEWDGFAVDITARHEAEAARRAAEAELQSTRRDLESLAANVPGLIFRRVVDADGSVRYPIVAGRLAGDFSLGGRRFASVRESLQFVHPDDREGAIASAEASARDLSTNERVYRALLPDGGIRWMELHAMPYPGDGGAIVHDGIAIDISARRQAELDLAEAREHSAAIAANLPGILFRRVLRADGSVVDTYIGGAFNDRVGARE